MIEDEDEVRAILAAVDPKARYDLRRVLIHDQPTMRHDAIVTPL